MPNPTAEICIPVSPGELLDRLAIAMIRCANTTQRPDREATIRRRDSLQSISECALNNRLETDGLFQSLLETNRRLWELEDKVRQFRDMPERSTEFLELAREIFCINDRRSELKRLIDREHGVTGETKLYRNAGSTEGGCNG